MRSNQTPGPARREVFVAAVVGVLLSCTMNFAVVKHVTTTLPGGIDGFLFAWQVSWTGHNFVDDPTKLWQSNVHYPHPDAMAFHDSLVGYGVPFGWIGSSPKAALIRFNLLYLFAYALAFFGAWFLARELGLGAMAAAFAGAAFAYAPFRLAHPDHLHVLSSGGIPMAIALMIRGYRRRSSRAVIGGWLVATWQLSLGFTTGLMLAYSLAGLGIVGAGWLVATRTRIGKHMIVSTTIGLAVFGGYAAVQTAPYLRTAERHPEAAYSEDTVRPYSPPPRGLLIAPKESLLYGTAMQGPRAELLVEQVLFPGAAVLVMAVIGLFSPLLSRWRRAALLGAVVVSVLLCMGFRSPLPWLYRFVFDHAPGWNGVRTPGRLTTLTTLALGILAASGVQWLAAFAGRRWRAPAGSAISGVLVGIALIEGAGRIPLHTPPPAPAARLGLPQPQLHLPFGASEDMRYMFWSVGEYPRLVNGNATFTPPALQQLRRDVAGFPDAHSVEALRALGVRTVVWHPALAAGTAWAKSGDSSIEGLEISKRVARDLVIFHL